MSGKPYWAFGVESVWHPNPVGTPDTLKATGQQLAVSGQGRTLLVTGFSTGAVSSGVATKIDIPAAFEVAGITLPAGSPLVDEGLNIMDVAIGNLPVGLE